MDGCDALQDVAAEKRRHRDGPARSCLQYDPRHEDHRHPSPDCRDEGLIRDALAKNGVLKSETDPDRRRGGILAKPEVSN